jgi:hypothetical protein
MKLEVIANAVEEKIIAFSIFMACITSSLHVPHFRAFLEMWPDYFYL